MSAASVVSSQLMQLKHITGMMLSKLDGGDPAFTAGGASTTTIAWSVGHLVISIDHLCNPALGIKSVAPARYVELFFVPGPANRVAEYPSLSEMTALFHQAIDAMIARVGAMSEEEFNAPLPADHPLAAVMGTVGNLILLTPWHAGYHLGQIGLLRRAQGLPSMF